MLEFRKELGIPHSLAEIGVTLRNPEEIGREAAIDPSAGGNPIPVDAADARAHLPLGGEGRPVAQELDVTRILVIDGNEKATRDKHVSVGGTSSGEGYAATLKRLKPGIECDIVRPADEEPKLPDGMALENYHGAVITGSALNIYSREAAVERQIDLAKAVFAAGVPCFGSCWGLQVGVTAAGGSVVRNPRGREFGFGRRITLTSQGRDHAMFLGKPEVFEAATVHVDTVESFARRRHGAGAQRHGPAGGRDQTQEGHVLGRAIPPGIQLRGDRGDGAALRRGVDS